MYNHELNTNYRNYVNTASELFMGMLSNMSPQDAVLIKQGKYLEQPRPSIRIFACDVLGESDDQYNPHLLIHASLNYKWICLTLSRFLVGLIRLKHSAKILDFYAVQYKILAFRHFSFLRQILPIRSRNRIARRNN